MAGFAAPRRDKEWGMFRFRRGMAREGIKT